MASDLVLRYRAKFICWKSLITRRLSRVIFWLSLMATKTVSEPCGRRYLAHQIPPGFFSSEPSAIVGVGVGIGVDFSSDTEFAPKKSSIKTAELFWLCSGFSGKRKKNSGFYGMDFLVKNWPFLSSHQTCSFWGTFELYN